MDLLDACFNQQKNRNHSQRKRKESVIGKQGMEEAKKTKSYEEKIKL